MGVLVPPDSVFGCLVDGPPGRFLIGKLGPRVAEIVGRLEDEDDLWVDCNDGKAESRLF